MDPEGSNGSHLLRLFAARAGHGKWELVEMLCWEFWPHWEARWPAERIGEGRRDFPQG